MVGFSIKFVTCYAKKDLLVCVWRAACHYGKVVSIIWPLI